MSRTTHRIAVVAALMVLAGAVYLNATSVAGFVEYPVGCDWFGYLRQARLFQERGTLGGLNTSVTDEITRYVRDIAMSLGRPLIDWKLAVAPLCHSYQPISGRIVVQYPPGVGWLFSFFPAGFQARASFVFCSFATVVVLGAILLHAMRAAIAAIAGGLGIVCLFAIHYFVNSWSLPPSILGSLLAGYLTVATFDASSDRDRTICALLLGLLLGLLVSFRIANLLLACGPAVVLLVDLVRRPARMALPPALAFVGSFAAGLVPVLAANAINSGSPLVSPYDSSSLVIQWKVIRSGLELFFVDDPMAGAFIFASALALIALALVRRRLQLADCGAILAAASLTFAANVGFFLCYPILASYYPIPFAIFTLSVCAFALIRSQTNRVATANGRIGLSAAALVILLVALVAVGAIRFPLPPDFERPNVTAPIEPRSVVWAGICSGCFEYFLRRQASVLYFAPTDVQDELVRRVARDGIGQVIVWDEYMQATIDRLRKDYTLRPIGTAFGRDVFAIEPRP